MDYNQAECIWGLIKVLCGGSEYHGIRETS